MSARYGVIIADPPWQYSNTGLNGTAEKHYATLSIKDLCQLPVVDLAAPDCVLLMWCTWPQMPDGLRLMEAWGFEYVTGFPWVKVTDVSKDLWGELTFDVPYGIGFWARGCSEFVLIGRRGKPQPPPDGFVGLLSPQLAHSRKPDSLHHYALAMPGPHLELFARRPYPGFDVWGNQVEGDLELSTVRG